MHTFKGVRVVHMVIHLPGVKTHFSLKQDFGWGNCHKKTTQKKNNNNNYNINNFFNLQSVKTTTSKQPIDYNRKYLRIKRLVKQLVFVSIDIIWFILLLATPVGNMKRIPCSDWLP